MHWVKLCTKLCQENEINLIVVRNNFINKILWIGLESILDQDKKSNLRLLKNNKIILKDEV